MTARPHILFVDDEPRILGGLRRMLHSYRDRWDMSFVEGAAAALEAMQEKPCDMIVTDYRMPGMNGGELLERVRHDYPGTARVILSGQTNDDNLLSIMLLAHEFLTKPTTPEQLVATVNRLISVREAAGDDATRHEVASVSSLPSPPHTLIELVEALNSEDASAQSVGTVIEKDAATTAKVLHLVNSSAYTAGRTVSNVGQAVALLGLHTVRGLVLMHDLVRTFVMTSDISPEWISRVSRHSVETSRLARQLAAGADWASYAFTAGLLHEVGQLVLASGHPPGFGTALTMWQAGETVLDDAEHNALGISHVDVGANLLGFWGLPAPIIAAVAAHRMTEPSGPVTDVTSAVSLAHAVVEAELGPVCGPPSVRGQDFELDPGVRDAVSQWRREQAHHR